MLNTSHKCSTCNLDFKFITIVYLVLELFLALSFVALWQKPGCLEDDVCVSYAKTGIVGIVTRFLLAFWAYNIHDMEKDFNPYQFVISIMMYVVSLCILNELTAFTCVQKNSLSINMGLFVYLTIETWEKRHLESQETDLYNKL